MMITLSDGITMHICECGVLHFDDDNHDCEAEALTPAEFAHAWKLALEHNAWMPLLPASIEDDA